jgi:hypothetical protein
MAYGRPYQEDPAASAAVWATMDALDWPGLLGRIDDGYARWRAPSLLLFGANDPFVTNSSAFDFLETKVGGFFIGQVWGVVGGREQWAARAGTRAHGLGAPVSPTPAV